LVISWPLDPVIFKKIYKLNSNPTHN